LLDDFHHAAHGEVADTAKLRVQDLELTGAGRR
jgi:hypothetical protein